MEELNSNKEKKSTHNSVLNFKLKRIIKIFFFALIITIAVKSFLINAFHIPTGSMKNTLLAGDYILVNKAAYSIRSPKHFPLTDFKVPSFKIFEIKNPERNDIIVFEHPAFFQGDNNKTQTLIKRIVGLPGDTFQIINKHIFINGKKYIAPISVKENLNLSIDNKIYDKKIFSYGEKWNADNYGPIIIPNKGQKINLNSKNINYWKLLIDNELGSKAVQEEGTVITINDKPTNEYILKDDYYFVLGDNRDNSVDSRFWGFVPSNFIIGKAEIIYWSVEPHPTSGVSSFFKSIRFNRFFQSIN